MMGISAHATVLQGCLLHLGRAACVLTLSSQSGNCDVMLRALQSVREHYNAGIYVLSSEQVCTALVHHVLYMATWPQPAQHAGNHTSTCMQECSSCRSSMFDIQDSQKRSSVMMGGSYQPAARNRPDHLRPKPCTLQTVAQRPA